MGTPHRGAELASTFYKIAKVFCPKKTVLSSQLIKSVKANSRFLLDTSASFRHQDLKRIISFYETYTMKGLNALVSSHRKPSVTPPSQSSIPNGMSLDPALMPNPNYKDSRAALGDTGLPWRIAGSLLCGSSWDVQIPVCRRLTASGYPRAFVPISSRRQRERLVFSKHPGGAIYLGFLSVH